MSSKNITEDSMLDHHSNFDQEDPYGANQNFEAQKDRDYDEIM